MLSWLGCAIVPEAVVRVWGRMGVEMLAWRGLRETCATGQPLCEGEIDGAGGRVGYGFSLPRKEEDACEDVIWACVSEDCEGCQRRKTVEGRGLQRHCGCVLVG